MWDRVRGTLQSRTSIILISRITYSLLRHRTTSTAYSRPSLYCHEYLTFPSSLSFFLCICIIVKAYLKQPYFYHILTRYLYHTHHTHTTTIDTISTHDTLTTMPSVISSCQNCKIGYVADIINGRLVPLCRTCTEGYRRSLVQDAKRNKDPVAKRVGEMKKTWDRMATNPKEANMFEAERRREMAIRARMGKRAERVYHLKEEEERVDRMVRD